MKRLFLLLTLLASLPALGSPAMVECTDVSTEAGRARIVLSSAASISHKIFTLASPDRVVIDIPDARLSGSLPEPRADDDTLIGLRSGIRGRGDLRIVVDLKRSVRVRSFPAARPQGAGQQLVVDLTPERSGDARRPLRERTVKAEAPVRRLSRSARSRPAVIAIDAGHGGQDPGAIGPNGTREKDVTLAIARKLARLVDAQSGMRAVLIRDSDTYVALRERILRARQHNADLFVSIHADAFNNPEARGSSVYTLSQGGASSEAANWLANRENSADLIGGVDLASSDELLATVLLDMTQNATIEHSKDAASSVLQHLKQLGVVHKSSVQRAGFVVLKSPDIPSILVETAFISNQDEERRLRTNAHQHQLAQAVLAGIRAYVRRYPPQGYVTARQEPGLEAVGRPSSAPPSVGGRAREHVISRGDTLSEIAARYRVSLSSLRAENNLGEDDYIRVGQILAIPTGS